MKENLQLKDIRVVRSVTKKEKHNIYSHKYNDFSFFLVLQQNWMIWAVASHKNVHSSCYTCTVQCRNSQF